MVNVLPLPYAGIGGRRRQGGESGAQGLISRDGIVNDRPKNVSLCVASLRWYYPDQVQRVAGLKTSSQSTTPSDNFSVAVREKEVKK